MTVPEAQQLCADINQCSGWVAWPARASNGAVPLVWFTRKDGTTRIYHCSLPIEFHQIRQQIEGAK